MMPRALVRPMRRARVVVILLALLASSLATPASGSSEPLPSLPTPVSQPAVAQDAQGHVYLVGGVSNASNFTDAIAVYDLATGDGRAFARIPSLANDTTGARELAAAGIVGGKLYVLGGLGWKAIPLQGRTQLLPTSFRDIVEVDLATGAATRLPDTLPYGLFSAGYAVWEGKVLLFGGITLEGNTNTFDTIIQFDPAMPAGSRVTTLAAALPLAESGASVVVDGDRALLFGGNVANSTENPCPIDMVLDPQTNSPKRDYKPICSSDVVMDVDLASGEVGRVAGHLPAVMSLSAARILGRDAYITAIRRDDGGPTDDVWRVPLDHVERASVLATRLPAPRATTGLATDGASLVLLGGIGRIFGPALADVTRVVPMSLPARPFPPAIEVAGATASAAWPAPDDGGATVTSYHLATADETFHQDAVGATWSGAVSGSPAIRVQARNVLGDSPPSVPTRIEAGTPSPAAPTGFAVSGSSGRIDLRWGAVEDPRVEGYEILRDADVLAVVDANQTTYADRDVALGATHWYEVRARTASVDGLPAGPLAGTATDAPPAPTNLTASLTLSPPSTQRARLTWTAAPGAEGYAVSRLDGSQEVFLGNASATVFADELRSPVTEYLVRGWNAHGLGPAATLRVARVASPPAPENVAARPAKDVIEITWDSVEAPGVTGVLYDVRVTDPEGTSWIAAQNQTALSLRVPVDGPGRYAVAVRVGAPLASIWSPKVAVDVAALAQGASDPAVSAADPTSGTSAHGPSVQISVFGQEDLTLTVGAQLEGLPSGTPVSWDWGDGTAPSTSLLPAHRYAAPGSYVVTLTARAPDQSILTATKNVTLSAAGGVASATGEARATPGFLPMLALLGAAGAALLRRRA